MNLLFWLFVSSLSFAQVKVDVSHLNSPESEGELRYESKEELSQQVRLTGVHLQIGEKVYFPEVHLASFLDEVVGTRICQMFGYGRGVLGPILEDKGVGTFEMYTNGSIRSLNPKIIQGRGYSRLATDTVICEPLQGVS